MIHYGWSWEFSLIVEFWLSRKSKHLNPWFSSRELHLRIHMMMRQAKNFTFFAQHRWLPPKLLMRETTMAIHPMGLPWRLKNWWNGYRIELCEIQMVKIIKPNGGLFIAHAIQGVLSNQLPTIDQQLQYFCRLFELKIVK